MTAAALVLQHLVSRVFTAGDYSWRDADGPRFFLDGWTQFDSFEYLDIAARGYWHAPGARSTVVFFPLYAVLIRAGSAVVDQPVLVGVVISGIGGVCAAVGLWRWYAVVRPGEAAEPDRRRIVLWVMLLYPFGWFQFAVVYSDAVFVAFVIAAFLAVERDRPLLAGVLGACASATRPTGVVVVAALWVRQLERDGVVAVSWERWSDRTRGRLWRPTLGLDGAAVRQHSWSPLLSLVGIGTFSAYLWARFGNPLLWMTSQTTYHGTGFHTWFKAGLVARWLDWSEPAASLSVTGQFAVVVAAVASAPTVGRRFGWGYAVLVAGLVAIPTVATEDFNGAGRYMLAAFPCAALAGEWLAGNRRRRLVWFGVSAVLLPIMIFGFSRSVMLT